MILTKPTFISNRHIAHSANVVFEILHSDAKYHLQNVIKMQVADLALALQIQQNITTKKQI